jgi:glycosyltransferase involved in cell wall biosynthesis
MPINTSRMNSKNRPLVSILITTFNSERYIREALESALSQSYRNIEVVVVDGGSTDGTRGIIESCPDGRLRAMFPGKRLGIKEARNVLFREARGQFITFLDADDVYLPRKVEEEIAFLETCPEFAAVYCDLRYFFDGAPQKLYRHRYKFPSGDLFRELLEKMFITNTTFMFRRSVYEALGGYDESLGMVEDWDYFLRMARAGFKIGFLDKDLVRFRLRWDNNTRFENQLVIQESALKIFERLQGEMSEEERRKYPIDAAVARRKIRVIVLYLAEGRRGDAWRLSVGLPLLWMVVTCLGMAAASVFPAALLRRVLGALWEQKRKNLFVPCREAPRT